METKTYCNKRNQKTLQKKEYKQEYMQVHIRVVGLPMRHELVQAHRRVSKEDRLRVTAPGARSPSYCRKKKQITLKVYKLYKQVTLSGRLSFWLYLFFYLFKNSTQ